MASQLILDRTDPGVDELVGSWADGEEYVVTLTIRQDASSDSVGNYTVLAVEAEESDEIQETEEEVVAPAPAVEEV